MGDDGESCIGRWVSLDEHLRDVSAEAERVALALALEPRLVKALSVAGRWHDVGKAHEAFQTALRKTAGVQIVPDGLQAKSAIDTSRLTYETTSGPRPGFRHELASALAWLQKGESDDLVAYLIAAHHGKVRLSIRSMPNERKPDDEERRFARGVWDDDVLPPIEGLFSDETSLDLGLMQLGEGSWLSRTLALRDQWGPFRLALLETLIRTADWKASEMERHDALVGVNA
ncbi:MAG TPA: CRISPR-associated endonuclease Cas3'' [Candidatus Xenobia bacterium]|jgi:CRISPR-associated endonuclease/helicase Cas3